MKKLLNNDFDERQLKIRGAVYLHTLIVMALLILANAFLRMNGVIWADELDVYKRQLPERPAAASYCPPLYSCRRSHLDSRYSPSSI